METNHDAVIRFIVQNKETSLKELENTLIAETLEKPTNYQAAPQSHLSDSRETLNNGG
jgi:hypothetical protein